MMKAILDSPAVSDRPADRARRGRRYLARSAPIRPTRSRARSICRSARRRSRSAFATACAPTISVFATYRSHGFYIAKGGRLDAMFAELYGRKGGISGGKAGSMHLAAPEVGLMGSSAVVASTIPHAVGAALSFKRRVAARARRGGVRRWRDRRGRLSREPEFRRAHEGAGAVPLRGQWPRRPQPSSGPPGLSSGRARRFVRHREPAGRGGLGCWPSGRRRSRPRHGSGPASRSCWRSSPRYKEHVGVGEDFHFNYRTKDGVDAWKSRDPLIVDAKLVEALRPELEREIAAAVAFAEASPAPGRAELLTDVI